MTLYEEVKVFLYNELNNYGCVNICGCDLAGYFTDEINTNGTVEFSRNGTIRKIHEHWDEYGSIYQYMIDNFNTPFNVFYDPEAFDAWAYYIIVEEILSKIPLVKENWNNEIELNFDNIELIQEAIENDDTEYFEY